MFLSADTKNENNVPPKTSVVEKVYRPHKEIELVSQKSFPGCEHFVRVKCSGKVGDGKMLQEGLLASSLNDPQETGRFSSNIANSKDYSSDSLACPQNGTRQINREEPSLLILPLDFLEALATGTLQKTTGHKPSSLSCVHSNSFTETFHHDGDGGEGSVFFPKVNVEPVSLQMKTCRFPTRREGSADSPRYEPFGSCSRMSTQNQRKATRGGDKRWQSKRTLALPAWWK